MKHKMAWVLFLVVMVLGAVTTVFAIDTSSALYTSNIQFLNLGATRTNFPIAQEISGSALIDDGFIAADTLNAVLHEGPNQIPGMPPNNRIVVEGSVVDDGGSFTEFTTEAQDSTELDVALLPLTPAVNDAHYFGCDNPCRIITVDVGQEGIGDWSLTWEYYNGTTFVTASNVSDRTLGFTLAGQRTVSFDMPSDFATSTITGSAVDAFWVRARVDSVTTSSQQAIANQEWYENGQWWAWGRSLSINEEILYNMSVGGPDLVTNHQIFPGTAGVITPDDASIELGDEYAVHWEGAISFITGSNVMCILCKGDSGTTPFRLYVSDADTNDITLAITGAGSTTITLSGLPDSEDTPTTIAPHVIDVISDGTDVTLSVAGVGITSGDAQTITDTADDYVWMNNGAAVYGENMYILLDATAAAVGLFDSEAEWDTGVLTDTVSTPGSAGVTIIQPIESASDDGFWQEGTSAFDNTNRLTRWGYQGNGGVTSDNSFYRFDNLRVEQGVTVTSAVLRFLPSGSDTNTTVNVLINGVDEDDAAAPSTFAEAEGSTRTTANVAWNSVPSFISPVPQASPDISSIVQEILDRPGWSSGNAMVLLVEDNGSTIASDRVRNSDSFESEGAAVRLEITLATTATDDFIEMEEISTVANGNFTEGWSATCAGTGVACKTTPSGMGGAQSQFGLHSFRVDGGVLSAATLTSDRMAAAAGQTWSFSARTWRFSAPGTASLSATFLDSGLSPLSSPSTSITVNSLLYLTTTLNGVVAPANTVWVQLSVQATGGDAVFVDGMMAAVAPTAPTFPDSSNQLVNPSFENVFQTSSTWVSPTINLTQTEVGSSLVVWDELAFFESSVVLETSIDGQSSWDMATNGEEIINISPGDDVSGGTLHIRATLTPGVVGAQQVISPLVSFVAVVITDEGVEDTTAMFYQLRTTPGVTIEDLSPNSNDGTMSYPVQFSGLFSDMTPFATTRTSLSQQAAIGVGDFAAPVTGSAASMNLFGQDDGSFLPGGGVLANAAASSGFPIGAIWAVAVLIAGLVLGAVVYNATQPNQLPASIVLAGTVVLASALGDGIIPGWVPIVTIMMLVAWNLLRSRLPI
jgi:hypothetical protein